MVSLLVTAGAAVVGCSDRDRGSRADTSALRQFDDFPVYWLGRRFERWQLASVAAPFGPEGFVSLIYGDCTPTGGDEPSCTPPVELQISALCSHLSVVARDPIWRHRRIRGAPVGTSDGAPVLFSRGAQVKVYHGQGSDPGVALRALRALRSLNEVAPVVGPSGRIPAAPRTVLRSRDCGS